MSTMIVLRLLHVLAGVFWAGTMLFIAGFLLPSVRASGPAGGQIMGQLVARGYPRFILGMAFVTVLSGAGMYWRNISVSAGAFARSRAGMTYGVGAIAALVTLAIGIAIITPTAGKLGRLGATIQAGGSPPSAEQASEVARLQSRMTLGVRLAAVFVATAVILMAIGRYV